MTLGTRDRNAPRIAETQHPQESSASEPTDGFGCGGSVLGYRVTGLFRVLKGEAWPERRLARAASFGFRARPEYFDQEYKASGFRHIIGGFLVCLFRVANDCSSLAVLASRVRCRQLGWELTRVYGCQRGVAGGEAPGYSHLQPPSAGGGLRINIIQLRKQSAKCFFSRHPSSRHDFTTSSFLFFLSSGGWGKMKLS